MKFVADTMLEKLARWLRLIGNDVVYDSSKSLKELVEISNNQKRVFLTRRKSFPENLLPLNVFEVKGENFELQLKSVIVQYGLDINTKLFTRCVDCNVYVKKINDKETIKEKIPLRSWEGFNEFNECPNCKKVFWKGAHFKNTMCKLGKIINVELK